MFMSLEETLAMPNLKIKIGNVISLGSEVVVIKVPKRGISADIFCVLSDANIRQISQLIIHQEHQNSYSDEAGCEEVIIPDELCRAEGIRSISLRGNLLKIPGWIFQEKNLEMLELAGSFETVPEMLGDLKELNTLTLTGNIVSLPKSVGNLSNLTSLKLGGNFTSVPLIVCKLEETDFT